MRKSLAIILGAFYILMSSWVVFNLHFCHGELAGITLYSNDSCNSCDHDCELGKECCEFQKIQLGIEDEHRTPAVSFTELVFVPIISEFAEFVEVFSEPDVPVYSSRDGPPVRNLRIDFCSLTFYS